jgi:hypothetical protein
MRHKIVRSLRTGNKFRREFRRQIRMLIMVTLGFTIAFTWRQTIFDTSQSIVSFFLHIQDSAALSILTSIFITLLAVLLVYLTAHLLKDGLEGH